MFFYFLTFGLLIAVGLAAIPLMSMVGEEQGKREAADAKARSMTQAQRSGSTGPATPQTAGVQRRPT